MFNNKLDIYMDKTLFDCRIAHIQKERFNFKDVDEEGNEVFKTFKPMEVRYYKNEAKKEEISKSDVYKLVDGKVRNKLKRTKEIKNFKLVNPEEAKDLIIEQYYLVDCEALREYLIKKNKIISCIYSFGNGFKIYECYITPYKTNYLIMVLGFGRITEQIKELTANQLTEEQKRRIEEDSNVKRAETEMMLAVYNHKSRK